MSLTKETLHQLYVVEGKTDKEIGLMYGISRTQVCRYRQRFDIPPRKVLGDRLIPAIERLTKEGFSVENLYLQNKLTDVDLIVNGHIRIEVLTANMSKRANQYNFCISTTPTEGQITPNENRILLKNGRIRKSFHKTCDFLLFVGLNGKQKTFWLFPSNEIPKNIGGIGLTDSVESKYNKYKNAFHQLETFNKTFTNEDLTKLQSAQMLLLKAHQAIVNTNGRTALADDLQATYFDVRELVDKMQRGAQ